MSNPCFAWLDSELPRGRAFLQFAAEPGDLALVKHTRWHVSGLLRLIHRRKSEDGVTKQRLID